MNSGLTSPALAKKFCSEAGSPGLSMAMGPGLTRSLLGVPENRRPWSGLAACIASAMRPGWN